LVSKIYLGIIFFFGIFTLNLKCLSLNVSGLNKSIKRHSIFRWLHKQIKDVIFLLEMYSSNITGKIWENEWGRKVLYNHGTCHSKGVMILLNPKLDCQIDEEVRDKNGRFLGARITLHDVQIVLANVYAPNDTTHQVLFLKEIQKLLSNFAQEKIITGGDFDFALSLNVKDEGNPASKKLLDIKEIDNLCHLYSLCDIWRFLNLTAKQFPWRNKSFLKSSVSLITF